MGSGQSSTASSDDRRVFPNEPSESEEYRIFQDLLNEPLSGEGSQWATKIDWPSNYTDDCFKMRVSLRPWTPGHPIMLLRGDGKYRDVKPEDFLEYLLDLKHLPGFQEQRDISSESPMIKYVRVKAPGLTARDHCWRYVVDRREDGSIFVCIRTVRHEACPEEKGVIRAYYYNATLLKMGVDEQDGGKPVCELTEFIFQDLKGGIPLWLMNAALPGGTISFNKSQMKHFKDTGKLQKANLNT